MHASAIHEAGRELVQGCSTKRWRGVSMRQCSDQEADVGARKGAPLTAWARPAEVGVWVPGYLGARWGTFEYQSGPYSIFNIDIRYSISNISLVDIQNATQKLNF